MSSPDDDDKRAWLRFVCTDRGRHPFTYLAEYRWSPEREYMTSTIQGWEDDGVPECKQRPDPWTVIERVDDPTDWKYEFFCHRCGRNPNMNRTSFRLLVDGPYHPRDWWTSACRVRDLDISLLPF